MLKPSNSRFLYSFAERRLNRDITSKLDAIQKDYELPKAARMARQRQQVFKILETASARVPYYRDLFKELGFKPKSVLDDIRAIEALPFLTKEIVREQGARLIREDLRTSQLHLRRTGGSTGISTSIYYDTPALDWTAAINLFAQSFTGRTYADREIHLAAPFQEMPLKRKFMEWLKVIAMNRVNISTHALSDQDLKELWGEICGVNAYLIQGHPSTLYALSKYLEHSQQAERDRLNKVNVFESTGESIDQKKIESIESTLGCKVYNRYGTAEFGVTAMSRESASQLEILDYIVYHESVSLGNGLEEIVGTTTTNTAMPLIRYRSGDVGQIKRTEDRDYLTQLQGRVHDLVEINGTVYPTHTIRSLLDRVGDVEEFQILQRKDGTQVLNLVTATQNKHEALRRRILESFGPSLQVKFIHFDQLVRMGWRDKFRYVIRE